MFSFGIIVENFEVFENDIFDCKVLKMVSEGEWNAVGFFLLTFVEQSIGDFLGACLSVVTAESE